MPTRPRPVAALLSRGGVAALAGLLVITACGGEIDPDASAAAPSTTQASPAPPTTAAVARTTTTRTPTTSGPRATTAQTTTTTTVAASTTTRVRRTTTSTRPSIVTIAPATTVRRTTTTTLVAEAPIAPPSDPDAVEPVIQVGSIAIPKLGVEMPMYEGIRLTTLDHGPGHWPGTAMPGQTGNVVVAGHRVSSHRVFRDVDQLVAGDEILFHDERGRHTYRVDRVEIVEPNAVWIVDPTETATATLFACHPPGSTAQRIVVFADLVEG